MTDRCEYLVKRIPLILTAGLYRFLISLIVADSFNIPDNAILPAVVGMRIRSAAVIAEIVIADNAGGVSMIIKSALCFIGCKISLIFLAGSDTVSSVSPVLPAIKYIPDCVT